MDAKERLMQIVEDKQNEFIKASDQIWHTPETRFAVEKSVQPYYDVLEKEGFEIKKGIADMDYSFEATWGKGKPVIGMLAEYDALGNLSQVAGATEHQPIVAGDNGHGCGHNVLGTAALAGAVAIKTLMEEEHLSGTIKLFGCPAEESGYGKAFMARDGIFSDLDIALANHPMDSMSGWGSSSLAVLQCYYQFTGIPAHAAAAPEMGRSALDAAELMNIGVQFLREHIIDSARIHYAFIDAGGESANVVQPSAKLYYFIRAPHVDQAKAIFARVNKIAEGAALMTETKLTKEFDAGCSDFIANKPLTRAIDRNLDIVGPLKLTKEELAFEKNSLRLFLMPASKIYIIGLSIHFLIGLKSRSKQKLILALLCTSCRLNLVMKLLVPLMSGMSAKSCQPLNLRMALNLKAPLHTAGNGFQMAFLVLLIRDYC